MNKERGMAVDGDEEDSHHEATPSMVDDRIDTDEQDDHEPHTSVSRG